MARWILPSVITVGVLAGAFVLLTLPTPTQPATNSQPTPADQNQTNRKPPSSPIPTQIPRSTIIATDLEVPWGLAFLPSGDILVTERVGRLKLIDERGNVKLITTLADVYQQGESGLHGIAIHPDFANNHFIYLYYTYAQKTNNTLNRVARFVFDGQRLTDRKIIVDDIPGALFHDGGRIKFGPDNLLYITTGDAQNPSLSQDTGSLAGKILRVTDLGQPAPDNPFNTIIYSFGHRNPQGITWDNQGRMWATEHGQNAHDELNLIVQGGNYGWPIIQGQQLQQDMIRPALESGDNTWAPAGAAFWNGSIFFGGLRGQALFEVKIDRSPVNLTKHLEKELGRIREVIVGEDNMLYITTSNRDGRGQPAKDDDRIIRINPNLLKTIK